MHRTTEVYEIIFYDGLNCQDLRSPPYISTFVLSGETDLGEWRVFGTYVLVTRK